MTGGLASSVGELVGKGSAGRRNGACRAEDARQRLLVFVRIKPETAVRDAPPPLNGSGLHCDHAGTADGKLHQVLEMPVGRAAVACRILTHGRHDDAVGELDRSDLERREEMGHGRTPSWEDEAQGSGGENSATRCYSMGPCPSTAHCRQFGAPDVPDPMSGVGRRATYAILTLLGPVLTILGPGGAMRDAECRIDARSMPDGCPAL